MFVVSPFVLELTDRQREAVELALERGYYDVPRTVTLDELGAELGITSGPMSARLRPTESKIIERAVRRLDGGPAEEIDGRGEGEKYDPSSDQYIQNELDELAEELGVVRQQQDRRHREGAS